MRNASALGWILLVAQVGACSNQAPSPRSSPDATAFDDPRAAANIEGAEGSPTTSPVPLRFGGYGEMPTGGWDGSVRSIFEDSKGNYWFGSWMKGVARFDGESFDYFTKEDGLGNNQIYRIQEDRRGIIWFETGNGVSSYDGERILTHTNIDSTSGGDWSLEPGDLWFGGDLGAYRYKGEELTFHAFPLEENGKSDWHYSVTHIANGEGGRVWFATWGAVFG